MSSQKESKDDFRIHVDACQIYSSDNFKTIAKRYYPMSLLSSKAPEFHDRLQRAYVSQLNQNGVDNVADYFGRLGLFDDGTIEDSESVREHLARADLPLEIFYRVAPTKEQDVMIATLNPGMQDNIDLSTFTDGEYCRQSDAGADLEEKAETVATNLDGFLTHPQNSFCDMIEILRSELDLLDGSGDYSNYVGCSEDSVLDGFFGEVCYTWMYKFATPDIGGLSKINGLCKGSAREEFQKEIFDVVDPKVLISVGKHGWVTVWEYLQENYSEDPEELIEAYSDKSPVTKSYNSTLEKGAYSGLYRVKSEDLWILTTWHASMWIKSGRLTENARRLNEELE